MGFDSNPKRKAVLRVLALVLILAACAAPLSAQCAMCRTSISKSAEGRRLAAGLRQGIVLLFFAPFAVFGTILFLVVRERRGRVVAHSGLPDEDGEAYFEGRVFREGASINSVAGGTVLPRSAIPPP